MNILLTPASIGAVEISNRIVMPPMTTRTAEEDGTVTEDTIAYYVARARGGVGLITVEMAAPEKAGRHRRRELGIHDDRFLPGLTRLVAAIHESGAKASIQLGHAGGHTRSDICGETPIAPSAIPHPVYEVTFETIIPDAMSHGRIDQTVQSFAAAAVRARSAGFDCVEIHGAHGYLLAQFLSPISNKRNDQYGGDRAGRMKFPLAAAKAVRENWPERKPMFIRVSAVDGGGGWDVDDTVAYAHELKALGIDVIDTSSGGLAGLSTAAPIKRALGFQVPFAAAVRRGAGIPTMAVGLILDGSQAEKVLQDGDADLIAIGRQALYNPFWPVHAAQELGCDLNFEMWNPEYGWWLDKRKNNLPPEHSATGSATGSAKGQPK